jgi:hypothetical protein
LRDGVARDDAASLAGIFTQATFSTAGLVAVSPRTEDAILVLAAIATMPRAGA